MAATLNWIVKDVESMIPSWNFSSSVKAVPTIGQAAPPSPLPLPKKQAAVLLFTRHMGCPFCEKEIKQLVALASKPENADVQFIIITHSVPTYELEKFVTEELEQKLGSNVTLHGDAERSVYAAYGIGELGLTSIINADIMSQVGKLKEEGIANRLTRGTRWQTNGGFAIDAEGKVRYVHVGKDSGDTTDLEKAISSVV